MNPIDSEGFFSLTLKHDRLAEIYDRLIDLDRPSYREKVIILTGPTGVGKSTACLRLVTEMNRRYEQEMLEDPSFIPVIYLRIPAPINGDFNWKDAFVRLLEQFNEVLIRRKVLKVPVIDLDGEVISRPNKLVREELRRSARNCIRHRRTRLLVIDEASHLLISKNRSFFYQQFEMIKSLSQDFGIPLLLSGAYDLLDIRDFNGQLTRRTRIIHFSRYSWEEVADATNPYGQSFRNTVFSLLEKMPVEKEAALMDHMDYFYAKSLGCVGLLKDWLMEALEIAVKQESPLTREILEQTTLPGNDLLTINREIRHGEARLQSVNEDDLVCSLGMDHVPNLFTSAKPVLTVTSEIAQGKARPKSKRNPGTRNPGRDLVGGTRHAA